MLSSQDIKKKTFELTLAVYRVTKLFPSTEALAHRLRERSGEVLEDIIFYQGLAKRKDIIGKEELLQRIASKIQALQSLFDVARAQNFVKALNFDILEWEYNQILELINEEFAMFNKPKDTIYEAVDKISSGFVPRESLYDSLRQLNERQTQMIEFFRNNGRARLKEVLALFPGVSEKTVRNDLKVLCEKSFIKLNGRAPQSHYSLR